MSSYTVKLPRFFPNASLNACTSLWTVKRKVGLRTREWKELTTRLRYCQNWMQKTIFFRRILRQASKRGILRIAAKAKKREETLKKPLLDVLMLQSNYL